MSPANRDRLRKKLSYYENFKQVGGNITPSEYMYIVKKFNIDKHNWESYVLKQFKKGETRPNWYYFYLPMNWLENI